MSNAMNWRTEPQSLSEGRNLQRVMVDNRIETLWEVATKLLSELDSLRSAQVGRVEGSVRLYDEVQRFEIGLIRSALDRTGGSQIRAARLLGVKPTTLSAKLKRYGLTTNGTEIEAERNQQHEVAA